ncbi:MAG: hypothetical protein AB8B72_00285 [Crocinitomicaceae bacterium]
MKSLYLFILFFTVANSSYSNANLKPHQPVREKVKKYDFNLEHTLKLEAKTGQNSFIESADLAKLKGQKIHHIDLVYSKYTGSNSFSQDQLNLQRINNLKRALPQVAKDEPSWKYIEQTGAKSLAEAKTYFHGFVLHYGPDLNYEHLKSFFKPFQTPHEVYTLNGKKGGEIKCGDGSSVHISGQSVTYADGTPIEGDFTIEYKEFKDPADIVFSGIPMTYNNGNENLNFSSVGMYDIRAKKNGKKLALSEPAKVDFNCTKPESGVAFYQMDDVSGKWTKKKEVSYGNSVRTVKYTRKSELDFDGQHYEFDWNVYSDYSTIQFDEASWNWFFNHIASHSTLTAMVRTFNETDKTAEVTGEPKAFMTLISDIMMAEKKAEIMRKRAELEEKERLRREREAARMDSIRAENAKIAKKSAAARQFSASMVNGLSSPDFGVYNCDQIYRLEEPLALSPTYFDESGNEITSKHVVCVMDLNFNGSFSFHPNNITCSGVGKNVILLFTDDKSVFMLSQDQFAQLNLNGNLRPEFKMKNMTAVIKTSDDLKKYLEI